MALGGLAHEGYADIDRWVNVTTATLALTAEDSNKKYRFNKADGIAVTLPAAIAGLKFRFAFQTSAAGGNTTITAAAGDLLIGAITAVDTDSSNAVVADDPDGSDDLIFTANGGTTGGLVGTVLDFEAITDNRWLVTGINRHSGNFATAFS